MTISIRRAAESDKPALSHICLLTGAAGSSAESLHEHGELIGLTYAVPYVKLPTTFGFVMVDDETSHVVGYVLGSSNTRVYEKEAETHWWPRLQARYPLEGPDKVGGTVADVRYMKLFHNMHTSAEEVIAFSPAHLHIDILQAYQRKGWGRKLIGKAVTYLRGEGLQGVWVGLDPNNLEAKKFYRKLGFEDIKTEGACMGLNFKDWNDPS